MGNLAIIEGTQPPATTPAGAQALRSIACSPAWAEDDPAEARRWLGPQIVDALPIALNEVDAQLAPATKGDARRHLGPTLALVAPAGMSEADQTAWIAAALSTLSGIPADLLERGCLAARRKVDHPSKIVAAIFAEINEAWTKRKRDRGNVLRLLALAGQAEDAVADTEYCDVDAARRIVDEFGLRRRGDEPQVRRHSGPPRAPTAEDYAEILGISVPEARARMGIASEAEA